MAAGGNASEGDDSPEKGGARWGRTTALVLLSIFGLFVLMIFVNSGMLAQSLSYLWPTVYYTEVFADVTVEGQRYQLTSTAKCTLRAKARFWGLVGGPTPATIDGGLLVKRLPSGAGLMIIGPALCSKHDLYKIIHKENFASDTSVRTVDLEKYLDIRKSPWKQPRVVWLDNAVEPSRIVAYWKEYVTRPGADIQVHKIQYKRREPGWLEWPEMQKPAEVIPWLKGRKTSDRQGSSICRWNEADWIGFHLDVVQEQSQLAHEELAYLREKTEITEIPYGADSQAIFEYRTNQNNMQVYGIHPDINDMVINLNNVNKNNIGIVNYYKRGMFTKNNDFLNQFHFSKSGISVKNNQKWMFFPEKNIFFMLSALPLYGKNRVCR